VGYTGRGTAEGKFLAGGEYALNTRSGAFLGLSTWPNGQCPGQTELPFHTARPVKLPLTGQNKGRKLQKEAAMKRFLLITTGAILLLSILFVRLATARPSFQAPPEMAQIALHPQEFPEGWTVRTREGVTQPDDTWHPLSRVNPSLISETFRKEIGDFLYTYTAYYQENQIWNGRFSGLAGNYIYQYASEEQARKVGEALVASARQAPNLFKEYDLPAKNGSVWGWAGKFRGEEGGDVDLFVGTKGPFLILLIVDGPPGEFQRGFEQLVGYLLHR
jgi:hypothetical protein